MLRSIFIAFLFISPAICAQHPLYFDQISSQAFVARAPGGSFAFTNRDIWLSDSVRIVLHGANRDGVLRGLDPLPGKSNYFLGPRSNWRTGIAQFARIEYKSVYPGIDLIFHPSGQEMEYDFVLAPGADATQIRLSFEGSRGLEVDENGNLLISTREGKLLQRVPYVFQGSETVDAKYALLDRGLVAFKLASYDKSKPLIIDPVVVFQNYIGGSRQDVPAGIGVDAKGNIYVAGTTNSIDFPRISQLQNPIHGSTLLASADYGQNYFRPNIDTPILQITAAHGQPDLLYAATTNGPYRSRDGGRNWMAANAGLEGITISSIAADTQDPARVFAATDLGVYRSDDAGETWRASNPVISSYYLTTSAMAVVPGSPQTLYVALNRQLYKSTDAAQTWTALLNPMPGGLVYIESITANASNPAIIFVGLESFVSSTLVHSLVKSVDGGITWSNPVLQNLTGSPQGVAFDPAKPSRIFAITSDGLAKSEDVGTSWKIVGLQGLTLRAISFDAAHSGTLYMVATEGIYVSSDMGSTFRPVTQQQPKRGLNTIFFTQSNTPLMLVGGDPGNDIFIVKWNPTGDRVLYSTYLGGSFEDTASAMKVDADGNVYVAGTTQSTDFPVTPGAAQARLKGMRNGFVSKISADGGRLLASTLIGGTGITDLNALDVDSTGNAYLSGYTNAADFPITPGVVQTHIAQGCNRDQPFGAAFGDVTAGDAFVTKVSPDASTFVFSTYLGGSCADAGYGIYVDTDGSVLVAGSTYSSDFPVIKVPKVVDGFLGQISGFLVRLDPHGASVSPTGSPDQLSANGFAVVTGVVSDGNIYATGITNCLSSAVVSVSSPATGFPFPSSCGWSLVKFDPVKSSPLYSLTFDTCETVIPTVSLDSSGNAWIAGGTPRPSPVPFPGCIVPVGNFELASLNSAKSRPNNSVPLVLPLQNFGQGILVEIAPDGASIPFSTALDGQSVIALDKGNAYVAFGSSRSSVRKEVLIGKYPGSSVSLMKIDPDRKYPIVIDPPLQAATRGYSYSDSIGPGEIVDIPGIGIGPATTVTGDLNSTGSLPKTLGGVMVSFAGIPAPLISVQSQTIRCVVPFEIAGAGSAAVQVQYNSAQSNAIKVNVSDAHVAIHSILNEDGSENSAENRASLGSILIVYASGLGQTDPPFSDGQVNRGSAKFALPISAGFFDIHIGTLNAEILYAGPAPGQVAGLAQFNIRLPAAWKGSTGYVRAGNSDGYFDVWVKP